MYKKKEFKGTPIVKFGMVFILGKSKKFDRDFFKVCEILDKGAANLTKADRLQLLFIYQTAYHKDGKIEGAFSFDSSATNCSFCKAMRAKAEKDQRHICNYCYDKKNENYRIESMNRHTLNMVIMMFVEFEPDELSIIPAGLINRIDSAGDIPNKTYARNMIKIAFINNNGKFAFWAKHEHALIAATDELGKPENAIYVKSSEIIGTPAALPKYFDYVFTVYPDEKSTRKAIEKGAAECNGKKCMECGWKCYYGTHTATNIAETLQGVNAKIRKQLIALCAEQ